MNKATSLQWRWESWEILNILQELIFKWPPLDASSRLKFYLQEISHSSSVESPFKNSSTLKCQWCVSFWKTWSMKWLQCPLTGLPICVAIIFHYFLVNSTFRIVKEIFPPGICEVTKQRESEVWNDCGVLWLGLLICFGCSECGNVPATSTHTSGGRGRRGVKGEGEEGEDDWGKGGMFQCNEPRPRFCKGVRKKILSCKLVHKFYSAVIVYIFRKHRS